MKKLLKNWIFYTVLAVLVIGVGIYFIIDNTTGKKIAYIAVGVAVLFYSAITIVPNLKRYQNKYSKICIFVEFALDVLVGIYMILDTKGANLLPLVIYARGFNSLLVRFISKKAGDPARYFIGIGLITMGTYIWAKDLIKADTLYYILLGSVFTAGIFLVILAIKYFKKK